jgi:hypothetical protein
MFFAENCKDPTPPLANSQKSSNQLLGLRNDKANREYGMLAIF